MSNIIEQSFKTNLRIMTFIGILPSKRHSTLTRIRGVFLYVTWLVLPALLAFIKLLSMDTKSDYLETNFMVIQLSENVGASFRLLPLFVNGQRLNKCVNYFAHPRFKPKNYEEQKIMDHCIRVCRRIGNTYLYGLLAVLFFWNFHAIMSEGNKLPVNLWLPFNPASNSAIYYTMVIILVLVITYVAFATAFLDPLIGSLTYHATCQLKILKYRLKNLNKSINIKLEDNYIIRFEEMHKNLKECLDLYNDIFQYIDLNIVLYCLIYIIFSFVYEFEEFISWPIFCQMASSIVTMCFSCIGLIQSPSGNVGTMINILCMFIPIFQTFCYCYFGTLLYEENKNLPDAIYMGPWYQYDVRIRKMLIIIMERSKRPLIMTSGKVIQLTLETFTSVFKATYSLIAVFNNYE